MTSGSAVVVHNVTAMRADPCGDAEEVSQALFGESVRLLDEQDPWVRIEAPEPYQGWVLRAHLAIGAQPVGEAMRVTSLFAPARLEPAAAAEQTTILPIGVIVDALPPSGAYVPIAVPLRGTWFVHVSDLTPCTKPLPPPTGENLIAAGRLFLGVPYLWGGRSPFGIDCSGFTQRCHALCGVVTPRDAGQQAEWDRAEPVAREGLRAGDLVFFAGGGDPHGRTISHVGMALGDGRFIHSRGGHGVTVNSLRDAPFDAIYWGARRLRAPGA